jgi:hypothetical protein
MKKYIFKTINYFTICFILIFVSCNKQNEEEYYSSGNLKSSKNYHPKDGNLEKTIYYYDLSGTKKIRVFYHKMNYDSVVYYYDNGRVFKTGKQDLKHNLYGKWNYFTKEGLLSDTKEYLVLNNKSSKGSILNQEWYFNQKGDTMFYGNNKFNIYKQKEFESESKGEKTSRFVRFVFGNKSDTVSITTPFICVAEDGFPTWGLANSESYIVLAKEKFNFNKDFSNEMKVKLDTFYCLAKDKKNGNKFPKADPRHTVVFGRWFDTHGKKTLRGYMVEYYTRKPTKNDSSVKYERRIYFEKIIYVKDTI